MQRVINSISFARTAQYTPRFRSPPLRSQGWGRCLQTCNSNKKLKRWKVKFIQRGSCPAVVQYPGEPLPVNNPSHHSSTVMSTPPAKVTNTVLLVTHDFAIARTLNKGFIAASHSELLKLIRLCGGNPLNLLFRNMQGERK